MGVYDVGIENIYVFCPVKSDGGRKINTERIIFLCKLLL